MEEDDAEMMAFLNDEGPPDIWRNDLSENESPVRGEASSSRTGSGDNPKSKFLSFQKLGKHAEIVSFFQVPFKVFKNFSLFFLPKACSPCVSGLYSMNALGRAKIDCLK